MTNEEDYMVSHAAPVFPLILDHRVSTLQVFVHHVRILSLLGPCEILLPWVHMTVSCALMLPLHLGPKLSHCFG